MARSFLGAVLIATAALGSALPAHSLERRVTVTGLVGEEMLKLRAGPGTGFRVIVGLPEGTALINRGCERVGGTPWCEVSLEEVRRLRGYVSGHYLKDE
ncbi:MAG: SH3 domain-containing protein [Pseudomonadota bacterium]